MARLLGALAIMTLVVIAAATPAGAQVFRPHTGRVMVANPVAAKLVERSTVVLLMRPNGTVPTAVPVAPGAATQVAAVPAPLPPPIGATTPGPITQPRQVATTTAPITTVAARRPTQQQADDATVTVEDDDAPAPKPKKPKKVKKPKANSDEDGGDVVIVEDE